MSTTFEVYPRTQRVPTFAELIELASTRLAIISFAYGIIAASLAELTDGIIYSEDSAWDYDRFPAVAADFYEWYFDPELTPDPDRAEWARGCFVAIASDQRL